MTDAKKLNSAPESPLRPEPKLFEADAVDAPAVGPEAFGNEATLLNMEKPPAMRQASFTRRFTTHLLVFLLIGLVMFGLGAGLAFALVTGVLDSHTAQLKEMVHHLKDLVHHSTSK